MSAVRHTRKPKIEFQNSSSYCSDKDSYVSIEKNNPGMVYCENKASETDITSEDDVESEKPPQHDEDRCVAGCVVNMDEQA